MTSIIRGFVNAQEHRILSVAKKGLRVVRLDRLYRLNWSSNTYDSLLSLFHLGNKTVGILKPEPFRTCPALWRKALRRPCRGCNLVIRLKVNGSVLVPMQGFISILVPDPRDRPFERRRHESSVWSRT